MTHITEIKQALATQDWEFMDLQLKDPQVLLEWCNQLVASVDLLMSRLELDERRIKSFKDQIDFLLEEKEILKRRRADDLRSMRGPRKNPPGHIGILPKTKEGVAPKKNKNGLVYSIFDELDGKKLTEIQKKRNMLTPEKDRFKPEAKKNRKRVGTLSKILRMEQDACGEGNW